MEYEDILEELQAAIRGIEVNAQFLLLLSDKKEVLSKECPQKIINECEKQILNSAEQYTYDYLAATKLLLDYKK